MLTKEAGDFWVTLFPETSVEAWLLDSESVSGAESPQELSHMSFDDVPSTRCIETDALSLSQGDFGCGPAAHCLWCKQGVEMDLCII